MGAVAAPLSLTWTMPATMTREATRGLEGELENVEFLRGL